MVVSSSQSSRRRRYAFFFTSILMGTAQLQPCLSQSHDRHQRSLVEEPKYKLTALPPFEIKLEIDLSKVFTGGNTQKNTRRKLLVKSHERRHGRRLNSSEGWMTNVDTASDNADNAQTATEPPKSNNSGGWFTNSDNDANENEYKSSQNYGSNYDSWYADETSSSLPALEPEQAAVDPLSSLSTIKEALQQTNTNGDKENISTYIRNLLAEYTTDFITLFSYEALQSRERVKRGWDVVHAIDLRTSLLDVTFYREETHFIEDSDNHDQEESFVSLTFGFSGTAAILRGSNVANAVKGDTIIGEGSTTGVHNPPIIGANELRLMLRAAFAPPDGPYKYLTYVLDKANDDRKEFILDKMTYEDSLEHAVTIFLGGSREVSVRTDLDYPNGASTLTFFGVGSKKAERRESLAVFFEGLFLVFFIGGFYVYASYKYRRNHLKQELMKYGEGAILVRSGEKTLFSADSKFKSKFRFMTKWLKYNRVKRKAPSPTSMETLEEDNYFGSESFDSDDYNDRDLEIGLKESYDESNRDKSGLDMEPIDVESFSSSGGVTTMKAIDDEMKENMLSSSRLMHQDMLQNMFQDGVVPIPAKDDENAAYLMSKRGKSKRKKSLQDGAGSVIVQRRYVQPAAPLEVLYGAAFLHGEAERVEAQRKLRKKKKIRASPSGRHRVKKKKKATAKLVEQAMSGQRSKHTVNPMMTITESIDEIAEEEHYDSDDDEDCVVPFSSYSPSTFMRNLSDWALGSKIGAEKDDDTREDKTEQGLDHEEGDDGDIQLSTNVTDVDSPQEASESEVGIDNEKKVENAVIDEISSHDASKEEETTEMDITEEAACSDISQPSEEYV